MSQNSANNPTNLKMILKNEQSTESLNKSSSLNNNTNNKRRQLPQLPPRTTAPPPSTNINGQQLNLISKKKIFSAKAYIVFFFKY